MTIEISNEPIKLEVAEAIEKIAMALKYLGNGDASTTMGAIEAHGMAIKESAETISSALESIASSIDNLASAIRESDFHE
jgi:hypothetical protein